MSRRLAHGPAAVALVLLVPAVAEACSLCHSPEALELRRLVFGPDFVRNLLSLALPLPILAGLVYLAGLERPQLPGKIK